MKRLFFFLSALLICVCGVMAIPAHPGTVRVQQPDGSYLSLRLVGDEWLHFNTTEDGYSVVKDSRGYYVYAELKGGQLLPTEQVAHDVSVRQQAEQAFLGHIRKYLKPDMTAETAAMKQRVEQRESQKRVMHRAAQYNYNNFKGLIVLVQYNDKSFSREDYKNILTDMVNQENYTGFDSYSYTGSVRDYFSDNSAGKFEPQFDVVGPYTVDYSQYDYNPNNGYSKSSQILNAAINAADADVDFSQYDGDGDGFVDLVYFILAGNGANFGGNDSRLWWPHRSVITNGWSYVVKDGVKLWDYASSVELYGYTSYPYTICIDGIGTICHEFSHVLGLPDFYDADYEDSGGESNHPDDWSVMAGGSYFNNGRTPVGYSLYERWDVGFLDEDPVVIDAEGSYTLNPLYSSNTGFRINSPVDNEFFLFENRQRNGFKWDAYLPGNGMLVHRVDKTNQNVWNNNTVNNNPSRNYYEVIRAGGKGRPATNASQGNTGSAYDVFPGTGQVHELHNATSPANLKTWAGESTKWGLKNIQMSGGIVTFDIENSLVLANLVLPEAVSVGVGLTMQLSVTAEPDYAVYTLTWESSDETVATVDQDGNVKGLKEGTCTITVRSDNGTTATCNLTVVELQAISLSEFKSKEVGTDALLQLTDAEVVYVYSGAAYVRDVTGSVMFYNTGLDLKKNDIINGTLYAKVGFSNNMPQVVGIAGSTNDANLTITAGGEVQPHEVHFEDLTPDYYSDYIVLKGATLERRNGNVWAVNGDETIRLYNVFQIKGVKVPADIDGKTFDVYGVYATNVVSGSVINEIEMVVSPVETITPPTLNGIMLSKTQLDMQIGDTEQLTVTTDPADFEGLTLTWTSSNEAVATIADGMVTAVGVGSCTLIVTTIEGPTATCEVTVTEATDIRGVRTERSGIEPVYNLQGVRVSSGTRGVVIRNGRKVVVK